MPEWLDNFEHESVTAENREAFVAANSKYETGNDAIVGGYNAAKITGKPYKLPESMDNLPDDASRSDFAAQARGLLGFEHASDLEGLADVNLKAGMAEGANFDEGFATAFKQFAVDNKIPKAMLAPIAEFFNKASGGATAAMAAKQTAEKEAAIKATNETLAAHADFGNLDKLKESEILTHRALINNLGLSEEEAGEVAEFLKDREGATNPTIRRVMLKAISPLAKEGSTESGTGTKQGEAVKQTPYEFRKSKFPNSSSSDLWGQPGDKWEDQSLELRRQAGFGKEKT